MKTIITTVLAIVLAAGYLQAGEITGTVLDWQDRPVNNAFVMLKENPSRSALTASDGEFCVDVTGITDEKTLQVSAAGSQVAVIAVTESVTEKLTVQLKQQSPVISELEIGCGQVNFRQRWSWSGRRPLTKDQAICVKAYNAFIISKKAEGIRNKILTSRRLSKDEEVYRYIVLADIALKGYKAGKLKTDLANLCQLYCKNILPHGMWFIGKPASET